jgi:uncharacterized Tic20 family protein
VSTAHSWIRTQKRAAWASHSLHCSGLVWLVSVIVWKQKRKKQEEKSEWQGKERMNFFVEYSRITVFVSLNKNNKKKGALKGI